MKPASQVFALCGVVALVGCAHSRPVHDDIRSIQEAVLCFNLSTFRTLQYPEHGYLLAVTAPEGWHQDAPTYLEDVFRGLPAPVYPMSRSYSPRQTSLHGVKGYATLIVAANPVFIGPRVATLRAGFGPSGTGDVDVYEYTLVRTSDAWLVQAFELKEHWLSEPRCAFTGQ